MDKQLTFKTVDPADKDFPLIKELYDSAFPPQERFFSVEDGIAYAKATGGAEMAAAYEDGQMVGFYAATVNLKMNYKVLHFLAVNPHIRNSGIGGRIMDKLLEENKDTVLFGSIERPVPGGENYELKARRQGFYERHGMIIVDRPRVLNGVEFIIATNKIGDEFERCYENEMKEEQKQVADAAKYKKE